MAGVLIGMGGTVLAQSEERDPALALEREFGVLGTDTREGRRYNTQMDRVVEQMVDAVNRTNRAGRFQLRSARILGGKSEKNDKVVNAFALPDGRIYVTLGLLRVLDDSNEPDDELAFVVGHEITHVTEKHAISQSKKAMPAGIAAVLLGALTKNRTIGTVAAAGAAAYSAKFSRQDEYRADRGGLLAMDQARFNLDSAITMLRRLESKGEQDNRFVNGVFGSHPLTANRVNRIEQMIADIRAGRPIADRSERDLEREDRSRRTRK